jgi:hypothetical protein
LRKEFYHAHLLSRYFQIEEKYHQTNLRFGLHKPFSFSYLEARRREKEKRALLRTPTTKKCDHFDLNHEIKATLLSLYLAIKPTPQNACILFLAPTAIVGRARITSDAAGFNKELNATADMQARRIEISPSSHSAAGLNIAAVSSSISLSAYIHVREAAMIFWKDGGKHK